MLQYRRTRGGVKIHRAACRHAATGAPWLFAENYTAGQIRELIARPLGLSPCLVCRPHLEG